MTNTQERDYMNSKNQNNSDAKKQLTNIKRWA